MPAPSPCSTCKWFNLVVAPLGRCQVHPPVIIQPLHYDLYNHIVDTSDFTDAALITAALITAYPTVTETEFCSLWEKVTP